eukprot:CAMPEP_0184860908 /NCGR_PEP_ID=MMETSP0580-20130426/5699_1 /TAXON_ID=1118495 /ORGANISM="Dactyliosolen fragilissimus" /LENGTH=1779 /DNA_ID=CAMNT_0027358181 /DNA_START=215 /DNA_END=5554 /DNA_ORIENTATION=+
MKKYKDSQSCISSSSAGGMVGNDKLEHGKEGRKKNFQPSGDRHDLKKEALDNLEDESNEECNQISLSISKNIESKVVIEPENVEENEVCNNSTRSKATSNIEKELHVSIPSKSCPNAEFKISVESENLQEDNVMDNIASQFPTASVAPCEAKTVFTNLESMNDEEDAGTNKSSNICSSITLNASNVPRNTLYQANVSVDNICRVNGNLSLLPTETRELGKSSSTGGVVVDDLISRCHSKDINLPEFSKPLESESPDDVMVSALKSNSRHANSRENVTTNPRDIKVDDEEISNYFSCNSSDHGSTIVEDKVIEPNNIMPHVSLNHNNGATVRGDTAYAQGISEFDKQMSLISSGLEFGRNTDKHIFSASSNPYLSNNFNKRNGIDSSCHSSDAGDSIFCTSSLVSSLTASSMASSSVCTSQNPSLKQLELLANRSPSAFGNFKRNRPNNSLKPDVNAKKEQILSKNLFTHTISQTEDPESNVDLKFPFHQYGCSNYKESIILAKEQSEILLKSSDKLVNSLLNYFHQNSQRPGHASSFSQSLERKEKEIKKTKRGFTLPAAAIGWLAICLYPSSREESDLVDRKQTKNICVVSNNSKHKLISLKEYLKENITHLRITGDAWPPDTTKLSQIRNEKETIAYMNDMEEVTNEQTIYFFLKHFKLLQIKPRVDMSIFPNVTHLSIEAIVPDWVENMQLLSDTLVELKVKRGCILDVRNFFGTAESDNCDKFKRIHGKENYSSQNSSCDRIAKQRLAFNTIASRDCPRRYDIHQSQHFINKSLDSEELANNSSLRPPCILSKDMMDMPKFFKMTNLQLSYCGIGDWSLISTFSNTKRQNNHEGINLTKGLASGEDVDERISIMSTMEELVSLDLSHNEINHLSTALHGLDNLTKLININLSHNMLQSMKNTHLMVGNIRQLNLSTNCLKDIRGLERLYSIEDLDLTYNLISSISNISGLAKLPLLMKLKVKGNPVEKDDPGKIRIHLLNLFKDSRFSFLGHLSSYRDLMEVLPILDEKVITKSELLTLKKLTYSNSLISFDQHFLMVNDLDNSDDCTIPNFKPTEGQVNLRAKERLFEPFKDLSDNIELPEQRRYIIRCKPRQKAFICDLKHYCVMNTLVQKKNNCTANNFSVSNDNMKENKEHSDVLEELTSYSVPFTFEDVINTVLPPELTEENEYSLENEDLDTNDDSLSAISKDESSAFEESSSSSLHSYEVKNEDDANAPNSLELGKLRHNTNLDPIFLEGDNGTIQSDANIKVKESINTNELKMEFKNSISQTTEDYSEQTNKNLEISCLSNQLNSKLKPSQFDEKPKCADRIIDATTELDQSINDFKTSLDETAKMCSSKVEREETSLDFGSAEKDSIYDGSKGYENLFVADYLEVYLQNFIFPCTGQCDTFDLEINLNNKNNLNHFPRIQLYQSDRELMMLTLLTRKSSTKKSLLPSDEASIEKFIAVSIEDLLPCGLAATARISPVNTNLKGFHGEFVYDGSLPMMISDAQKIIFCISDTAVYFIPSNLQSHEKEDSKFVTRSFPSIIPKGARFKDGYWLHALARHPLKFLRKITIGFGFQRLMLRFKLPGLRDELYMQPESEMMSSSDYTYILFTCNKHRTIELLQILQLTSKNASPGGSHSIIIENDDAIFLDSLSSSLGPNIFDGAVIQYQILHQRWLKGNREPVRRACVLTQDHLFLLSEFYRGDMSTSAYESDEIGHVGDLSMHPIDFTHLKNITEICGAHEDPRFITIVIKAPSRIKRNHNWRLLCHDGESAEKLVEEVRKATALICGN